MFNYCKGFDFTSSEKRFLFVSTIYRFITKYFQIILIFLKNITFIELLKLHKVSLNVLYVMSTNLIK